VSRRSEGLPGSWVVLFVRAVVEHPAGYDPSLPLPLFEEIHGKAVVAFRRNRTLGIRNGIAFEAANPTAHTLACLRFAGRVTGTGARLTTGSGGLTPGRAGFAPAGRQTKFHGVIASPFPFDQQCLVALYLLCPSTIECLWTAKTRIARRIISGRITLNWRVPSSRTRLGLFSRAISIRLDPEGGELHPEIDPFVDERAESREVSELTLDGYHLVPANEARGVFPLAGDAELVVGPVLLRGRRFAAAPRYPADVVLLGQASRP